MSENTEELSSNALVVINNESKSTVVGLKKCSSSTSNDNDNAPLILFNELVVSSQKSKSLEKLDELSCLEREIAKMHHADDANLDLDGSLSTHVENQKDQMQNTNTLSSSTDEIDMSNGKNSNKEHGHQEVNLNDKLDAITSDETALEHEDLIAVLKGLDGNNDETHNNCSRPESILEGVTIEGEGEYQIMEVIDDDSNATEEIPRLADSIASTANPIVQCINNPKPFVPTILTAQEERALALEQMESIKTIKCRRKQQIKPIKQIDSALDLVSALEADWSELDEELSEVPKSQIESSKSINKNKVVASTISENKKNASLITSVVVIPSVTIPSAAVQNVKVSVSGNNKSSSEQMKESKIPPAGNVIETKAEDSQVIPSQSGFRRTRVIKRKIIWDPDAPETTFSYAKLVKPNTNTNTKVTTEPILTTAIKKGSTTITPIKKESVTSTNPTVTKKTQRPATPKVKNTAIDTDVNNEKKSTAVKTENSSLSKDVTEKEVIKSNNKTEELNAKAAPSSEVKSSPTTIETPTSQTTSPKRRSQTPVANGSGCGAGVKKKKFTELDRLMRDEGAVNMLNSLEKLEATLGSGEAKSTRPMMRNRAATICEKLPRKETPSPVRTSTNASPTATTNSQTNNRGKRTPKSRASSSWDYVYKKKKQDFDDSLIIRRRSNSSYSSTTSLNRLSLDAPPASNANNANNSAIKSNESKTLPASKNESVVAKTSASSSSHNKSSSGSKSRSTPTPPVGKTFEFAKPEIKKSKKRTKSPATTLTNDMKKAAPPASKRNARSPETAIDDNKGKELVNKTQPEKSTNAKENKDGTATPNIVSDVVVKKSSKAAQIIFSTSKAKLSNTFTIQMLNKLVDILDKLALDPDCNVVVIGTNDAHFCQGVDISDLLTIPAEKRKKYAANLATSVKNYLKTLATYPKPIIAGVNGNIMNLGVVQLALFDIVIASDKTTFETPYAKMGQIPEGYCIWHGMNKIRGSFKTKLFWLGEKAQSTEAALAGLVNKLTSANKINDDALMTAKRIASLSSEPYRHMKKTAVNSHLDAIVKSLDDEFNTIMKQWSSNECLENLKKYIGRN